MRSILKPFYSGLLLPLVITTALADLATNPMSQMSTLQYEVPDFAAIRDEHFMPAFEEGMKEQIRVVEEIASNPEPATFENTLVALEKSSPLLTRVSRIFYNLYGTDSNDARRAIASELAPRLAAHSDNIFLNADLFARVDALFQRRSSLALDPESDRLLEDYHTSFVRAGAQLTAEQQTAIRALNEEHSTLTNLFAQNLLAETRRIAVIVDTVEELDGLSESEILAAAQAAKDAGHDGKYLLSITNTTRQPVLNRLHNREVRQRVWEASALRAREGEFDNSPIVLRLTEIRAERAKLLGYENWATFGLEDQMAGTPKAVFDMLGSMVPSVVANVHKEQQAIQEMIRKRGGDFEIQPWDWEYYAEFVRQEVYELDESEVREYFEFDRVLNDGVFYLLGRFYGIRFVPRPDIPVYHPTSGHGRYSTKTGPASPFSSATILPVKESAEGRG
jgi:peptidyl-dipeptidase Dcp